MKVDRVADLKERLATLVGGDVRVMNETRLALDRMLDLGLESVAVRKLLVDNPLDPNTVFDASADKGFCGFKSRRQAGLAAFGGLNKGEWPAALQGAHERVKELIKIQEAEAPAGGDNQIIMMPVVMQVDGPVKSFRRLRSGKLKELTSVVDVEEVEEEVEAPAHVEVDLK
jgi:hypothetical protein